MSPERFSDAGFLYEVLNQTGASGSPVFDETGTVLGVHVEWQEDTDRIRETVDEHHTGLSVAVSSRFVANRVQRLASDTMPDGSPRLIPPGDDWVHFDDLHGRIVKRARAADVSEPGMIVMSSADLMSDDDE
jgi:hypothetical protein